jgi:hypothetical protein
VQFLHELPPTVKAYQTRYYNLDAIIAVGYRVNSYQAMQFQESCTLGPLRAPLLPKLRSERWILALADFSYVVILDDRGEFILPWADYPVAETHRRRKLEKEYNDWKNAQKS